MRRGDRDRESDDFNLHREIFDRAFKITSGEIGDASSVHAGVMRAINGKNRSIDDMTSKISSSFNISCRESCDFCCHQMVVCSPFEAMYIAYYIISSYSLDGVKEVCRRLDDQYSIPLDPAARGGRGHPCAFLEDHRCKVYEVRPSACRSLLSLSAEACREGMDSGASVPYVGESIVVATAMQLGMDYALSSGHDLNCEPVEMGRAVRASLDDLDGILSSWLEGGRPFPDAEVRRDHIPSRKDLVDGAARLFGIKK